MNRSISMGRWLSKRMELRVAIWYCILASEESELNGIVIPKIDAAKSADPIAFLGRIKNDVWIFFIAISCYPVIQMSLITATEDQKFCPVLFAEVEHQGNPCILSWRTSIGPKLSRFTLTCGPQMVRWEQ